MKSGFVVLIGRSNVGKSTLLNALTGRKLAIVTPKPQTTRQVIHGVVNDPRGQIVFVDTPGVFLDAKGPLTSRLLARVHEALRDIDLILYVVDPTREIGPEERRTLSMVRHAQGPKLMVINKTDLPQKRRPFAEDYRLLKDEEGFQEVIEVSALKNKHLSNILDAIFPRLPEGEAIYPLGEPTNIDERFWIAELIREKVFHTMGDEVPYSTTVRVDSIEEKPEIKVIHATIVTNATRYKPMIIGKAGAKIKEMGTTARKELETLLNKKVFLALEVEVEEKWQEREM